MTTTPQFERTLPDAYGAPDAIHVTAMRGELDEQTYSFVSLHEIGPRGGYYGGPTFYSRERLDQYIDALREAADHVQLPATEADAGRV
jgi:hypothetical protein